MQRSFNAQPLLLMDLDSQILEIHNYSVGSMTRTDNVGVGTTGADVSSREAKNLAATVFPTLHSLPPCSLQLVPSAPLLAQATMLYVLSIHQSPIPHIFSVEHSTVLNREEHELQNQWWAVFHFDNGQPSLNT